MTQAKNYCFTYNNPPCLLQLEHISQLQYGVYGEEVAPTTGTRHLQGYLQFIRRVRMTKVCKIIPTAHFEVARGTPAQNIVYCKKGGIYHEFGVPSTAEGTSSELDDAIDAIEGGASATRIATEYPKLYMHRSRGVSDMIRAVYKPALRMPMTVIVLFGASGTGKTRYAYDTYGPDKVYKLDTNMNGSLWFDGYNDQPVLLIDDFQGWIPFRTLLNILDIYPYLCQVKGSSCYAKWTTVIITSEIEPVHWFGHMVGDYQQLARRITEIRHLNNPSVDILPRNGLSPQNQDNPAPISQNQAVPS